MGTIALALPLVLQALELAPKLISGGQRVYDGAKAIWDGATSDEAPTAAQQQQYDDAERAAFNALMESTKDVAEEGDEKPE